MGEKWAELRGSSHRTQFVIIKSYILLLFRPWRGSVCVCVHALVCVRARHICLHIVSVVENFSVT